MNKMSTAKYLMMAAIFTIAAFQGYWLYKLYFEEYNNIQKQADVLLKESVQQLKETTLKNDSSLQQFFQDKANHQKETILYDTIREKVKTNLDKEENSKPTLVINSKNKDSAKKVSASIDLRLSDLFGKEINDSLLSNLHPNKIRDIKIIKDSSFFKQKGILISSRNRNNDSGIVNFIENFNPLDCLKQNSAIKIDSFFVTPKKNNKPFKVIRKITGDTIRDIDLSSLIIKIFRDSIAPEKVDSVFKKSLAKQKVNLPFKLVAKRVEKDSTPIIDTTKKSLSTNPVTIGLTKPLAYQAEFENPFWFIVKRLTLPISMSLLLLGFVSVAFIFLYRNMRAQQKLAAMKTDFISNITHELKTPIATVNVAIEAMRNFNALDDKKKTQDYLDISALEINRLGLLVDNVLKLSMFENDKVELQTEEFDVVALAQEVLTALTIQIDKKKALIDFNAVPNNIFIKADKLHVTSILFNLIDNALKYSTTNPEIKINLLKENNHLRMSVFDNGIGISKEHQQKIFNKFYRIQTGDRHNTKGYGLGLSYVDYIVKKHNGSITVKSELNKGSEFMVVLPI